MKSFILAAALLLSTSAFADVNTYAFISSHSVRGCNFWSYSQDARGYVCSNPDMSVRVPDSMDVERAFMNLERSVQTLETKVRELEGRLQTLESKNP